MIRRPPRSTQSRSSAASDVYKRQKLDLSRKTNIPEATADGRPNDFMGVYIQDGIIGFPQFWNHDDSNSTGQIVARNLLVGTGGISGTLGLEAKTAGNPSLIHISEPTRRTPISYAVF